MAFHPALLSIFLILLPITSLATSPLKITLVNNCPYTIWPAIQPNTPHPVLERGGFALKTLTHHSFPAPPTLWTGRIWARTGCTYTHPHGFHCQTGDCGNRFECSGKGGVPPATLAQISLRHGPANSLASYGVSLVDGFNVPLTITPHEGKGHCPVVGCKADLLASCPPELRVNVGGRVVGCKSGCEAFRKDEFCCTGRFNSASVCKASHWSEFFKSACPATFTYAHDSPGMMHDCSSPAEVKVIFCH